MAVEENDECRVCRGPAETDRPLLSPCRCSGSIQYCHEWCLLQWLKHANKERCELCGFKFLFQPVYADGIPERLPCFDVLKSCFRRFLTEWVPLIFRVSTVCDILTAAMLWGVSEPLISSWLYRMWMHRSRFDAGRFTVSCLWRDWVSGLIITGAIVLSFISLMSFADFLRLHRDVGNLGGGEHQRRRRADIPDAGRQMERDVPGEARAEGVEGENEDAVNDLEVLPAVEDDDDDDGNGNDQLDIELHAAVDDLLGIRGPTLILLRNLVCLLAFNCAYLGLFAFIPFSIGSSIVLAARSYVELAGMSINGLGIKTHHSEWLAGSIGILTEISVISSKEGHTLQLIDLVMIVFGYLVISSAIFTWQYILRVLCQGMPISLLGRVRVALDCLAAMVKVCVLLFLKMLLLPLILGIFLDASTLPIFAVTAKDRIYFTSHNLVGSMLLHWVLGITFMLFVTVSVLQLREVLHPDIFAAVIRPQEPHPDLLGSLLQDTGLIHARRMILSFAIYVILLSLFIWIPTSLVKASLPHTLPIEFRINYILPQVQVPIELIVFHLFVLAFLERIKNRIGELQHSWLVVACRILGLTVYLLPLQRLSGEPGELVGVPLQRPPPGWDDLIEGGAQGRWAWGDEPRSPLELGLATRKRPSFAFLRLVALLCGCWVTVLSVMVIGPTLPLYMGRAFFGLLYVRTGHDPLAFAVGCTMVLLFKNWAQVNLTIFDHVSFGRWANMIAFNPPPLSALGALGSFVVLWFGLAPILMGLFFEACFVTQAELWELNGFAVLQPFQDWMLGIILLHTWAILSLLDFPIWRRQVELVTEPEILVSTFSKILRLLVRTGHSPIQIRIRRASESLVAAAQCRWRSMSSDVLVWDFALPVVFDIFLVATTPIAGVVFLALFDLIPWPMLHNLCDDSAMTSYCFFLTSPLQLVVYRRVVLALCVCAILSLSTEPLEAWFDSLHDSVRDEKYLVGLELKDFVGSRLRHPRTASAPS